MSFLKETQGNGYLTKDGTIDIESIPATTDLDLGNFGKYTHISIQIFASGLTGTLDGTVAIKQTAKNEVPSVAISGATDTIDTDDASYIIEITDFTSNNLILSLDKVGITAGTLRVLIVAK